MRAESIDASVKHLGRRQTRCFTEDLAFEVFAGRA
jgi:hypothetical protein